MINFEDFTNLYSQEKTIRVGIEPQKYTKMYLESSGLIKSDDQLNDEFQKMKGIIDCYHKVVIDKVLSSISLDINSLQNYEKLYKKNSLDEKEANEFLCLKDDLRKQIVAKFKASNDFKSLFGKNLIEDILPKAIEDKTINIEGASDIVPKFEKKTILLTGFHENRKNIYTDEAKKTAIAYRLIHENLPRFLDNICAYEKISAIPELKSSLEQLYKEFEEYLNVCSIDELFSLENYSSTLTQKDIDAYNIVIGGYSLKQGEKKIQGINELVKEYNDKAKDEKDELPLLKNLYKQILSDRNQIPWQTNGITSDEEMLWAIENTYNDFFVNKDEHGKTYGERLGNLLRGIGLYSTDKIFVANDKQLKEISVRLTDNYDTILLGLCKLKGTTIIRQHLKESDKAYEKRLEKEQEKIVRETEKIKNLSLDDVNAAFRIEGFKKTIESYFAKIDGTNANNNLFERISKAHSKFEILLGKDYSEKKVADNEKDVERVQNLLILFVELRRFVRPLLGKELQGNKDLAFYCEMSNCWEKLSVLYQLYDKVRNYITQKQYSTDKIRLFFNKTQLVKNWPKLEQGFLLKNIANTEFYLAIPVESSTTELLRVQPKGEEDIIQLMNYQQDKAGHTIPNLMYKNGIAVKVNGHKLDVNINDDSEQKVQFEWKGEAYHGNLVNDKVVVMIEGKTLSCQLDKKENTINVDLELERELNLPDDIKNIRKKGSYLAGDCFSPEDCVRYINYYKELYLAYKKANAKLKNAEDYKDFNDFLNDIDEKAYSMRVCQNRRILFLYCFEN